MHLRPPRVVHEGDESGNGMAVEFRLPSGLKIFGLPTENFYGGHWDLGPTWNYVVMADEPFLVDSGRYGQVKSLVAGMEAVGVSPAELSFVLVSHGHEDHDGGLAELVRTTRLRVKAHAVYSRLIRRCPEHAPRGHKHLFPAKCWHCFLPPSFSESTCMDYHRVLQELTVETIGDGRTRLGNGIEVLHLPGHSPDALAVVLGNEAVIVGDTVLPGITPWPTREAAYAEVAPVIAGDYPRAEALFGLRRFIRSLRRLAEIGAEHPDILVLPAHRFYFKGRWNGITLTVRIGELIGHHLARCAAILEILKSGPKTAEQVAQSHFEDRLLKGFGRFMAANEIMSHLELLNAAGDVAMANGGEVHATGTGSFEDMIAALR